MVAGDFPAVFLYKKRGRISPAPFLLLLAQLLKGQRPGLAVYLETSVSLKRFYRIQTSGTDVYAEGAVKAFRIVSVAVQQAL